MAKIVIDLDGVICEIKKKEMTYANVAPLPGAGKLEAATAPRIRIGPFEQTDVPLLVAERGAQGAGARSEALLGVELLQDYVIRLDYPRKRFWIAERERP